MNLHKPKNKVSKSLCLRSAVVCVLTLALACPFNIFSVNPRKPYVPQRRQSSPLAELPDSLPLDHPVLPGEAVEQLSLSVNGDSVSVMPVDTVAIVAVSPEALSRDSISVADNKPYIFNPDPTRAVWLSALFPGLGQIYNRRYWKLPIVVGAFMGLGYATSWNNGMLRDYSRAYADLLDNDPATKSYMDFFPPTTNEADLNRTWLTNVMKSRKDYYRRNRDLCIICMVGVYLIAMVDAYVDASLAHFDISPNLSVDMAPALIQDSRDKLPGVGLQWALNF